MEKRVVAEVGNLNRSVISEDKMVMGNSDEQSKQSGELLEHCVKCTENRSGIDENPMILDEFSPKASKLNNENVHQPFGPSAFDGTPKQLKQDAKLILESPGACGNGFKVDSSPGLSLEQSQGVAKRNVKGSGKPTKRKRVLADVNVISSDRDSLVTECRRELDSLFEYYKELASRILNLEEGVFSSDKSLIACLLEESSLPYSKLVEVIYEKLKGKEGVSLTSVRGAILSIGERKQYGIENAEADVLEDESESCLWCWEVTCFLALYQYFVLISQFIVLISVVFLWIYKS